MQTPKDTSLKSLLSPYPPKAGPLIVTIYGDIVEPRGGSLWVGDLITLCGKFGVNESLVRTAVSRLVSRDQLQGEREGRRSYYSLTPSARSDFHAAADRIFGPPDSECQLLMVIQPDKSAQDQLFEQGFGAVGDSLFLGVDRPGRTSTGARFRAVPDRASDLETQALLSRAFDLGSLARAYKDFIQRFGVLTAKTIDGLQALTLRLAMVHAYRAIRLKDPQLPPSVLPEDWPGHAARSLFAESYLQLSEAADPYIGDTLQGRSALLAAHPDALDVRFTALRQSA
ncbi:PaaX family transcriptional regulator C-terminal domain-containing protein [Labrenzia sp. PHM005]|uniref:PaaX family transcriptional regulator C-terminal domain-containing protein n=1 Tax=Labrenzia sp. PHM005 TaxID=2590016 RepID=UPI00113FE9FF|nr:PaaX family transcriptional regulator C-terminal domain-containing protein [Labrenzia sp. PHM005]QDG77732.1 PaaX family transcriptional regulator [Labrenzia sp. PHM005]